MGTLSSSAIGRLRLTGFAEAISWLLLLLIAMPLKYMWHIPQPVRFVGWAHGLLFIIYMLLLINVGIARKWPIKKMLMGFFAAFLPFGTLVFDKQLKKEA